MKILDKKIVMSGAMIAGLSGAVLPTLAMEVEQVLAAGSENWVVVTEDKGLVVFDNQGKQVSVTAGKYAQAAYVDLPSEQDVLLAVNGATNALDVFSWQDGKLTLQESFVEPVAELSGICSYYQANEQAVYSFLLRDEQPVVQRVHYLLDGQTPVSIDVRELSGGASLVGCYVNNVAEQVYFVEENVGIWHANAHPERDSQRGIDYVSGGEEEQMPALAHTKGGITLAAIGKAVVNLSANGKVQASLGRAGRQALRTEPDGSLSVFSFDEDNGAKVNAVSLGMVDKRVEPRFKAVFADRETQHVGHYGDAADDPAIWVNRKNPRQSLVFGTDKKRGLAVYDMEGKVRQFIETGRVNNVDLRTAEINGQPQVLVAASNRDTNGIALYALSESTLSLHYVGDFSTTLDEVYGLCATMSERGRFRVLINDKDGRYQVYDFEKQGDSFHHELMMEFALKDQPEGCVVDDHTQVVFMGVENSSIFKGVLTDRSLTNLQEIVTVGGPLQADIEGMELYQRQGHDYLVVSSQGNNSYAFYQTKAPHAYLGSVVVEANLTAGIDGASETDGLAVTAEAIGDLYPHGVLVVQDGRNVLPAEPQNFKYVDFADILRSLARQKAEDR